MGARLFGRRRARPRARPSNAPFRLCHARRAGTDRPPHRPLARARPEQALRAPPRGAGPLVRSRAGDRASRPSRVCRRRETGLLDLGEQNVLAQARAGRGRRAHWPLPQMGAPVLPGACRRIPTRPDREPSPVQAVSRSGTAAAARSGGVDGGCRCWWRRWPAQGARLGDQHDPDDRSPHGHHLLSSHHCGLDPHGPHRLERAGAPACG